eukprot:3821497-Lingulodinium_polyedra.AAC.1
MSSLFGPLVPLNGPLDCLLIDCGLTLFASLSVANAVSSTLRARATRSGNDVRRMMSGAMTPGFGTSLLGCWVAMARRHPLATLT